MKIVVQPFWELAEFSELSHALALWFESSFFAIKLQNAHLLQKYFHLF